MEESMFEFASCLSTVGLSCGLITMYSSNVILWTAIVGMYLGRLEIFAVIYTIINLTSRKWSDYPYAKTKII